MGSWTWSCSCRGGGRRNRPNCGTLRMFSSTVGPKPAFRPRIWPTKRSQIVAHFGLCYRSDATNFCRKYTWACVSTNFQEWKPNKIQPGGAGKIKETSIPSISSIGSWKLKVQLTKPKIAFAAIRRGFAAPDGVERIENGTCKPAKQPPKCLLMSIDFLEPKYQSSFLGVAASFRTEQV